MPSTKLTEAGVKRLSKPESGQVDHFDAYIPGFGIRVSKKGRKSWFVTYRVKAGPARGKQRRYTFPSSYPALGLAEARQKAREVLEAIERGEDPSLDKRNHLLSVSTAVSFREAVEVFVQRYAKPRNKSWKETQRILIKCADSGLGERALESIQHRELASLIDQISETAPVMANRSLSALKKMMSWHVGRGTIFTSPSEAIDPPAKEVQRERALTDNEIRWFWQACDEVGYPFGDLFKLLLVTGQRRNEVGAACWAEFDLDKNLWLVPRQRTKPDRDHEVALTGIAIQLLYSLPRRGSLLFSTSANGERLVSGYSQAKVRLSEKMEAIAGQGITPWRIHDLRRTAGTGMAASGIPVSTISRVLNHAEGGVTQIYNRFTYSDEKRQALEKWEMYLRNILSEKTHSAKSHCLPSNNH